MNNQTARARRLTYYATQIEMGWITLDVVPVRYREDVKKLVEAKKAHTEQEE